LDYLLFGLGNDTETLTLYQNEAAYRDYLGELIDRLQTLGQEVLDDWNNGYRDQFVANSCSDANSSVNKLVNDFMFYYEKSLRAGKVGIPAGVFSGSPLPEKVEGLHSRVYSKDLLEAALQTSIDFFNGNHTDGTDSGESLKSYLDFLNTITNGENLSTLINNQFQDAEVQITTLDDDLYQEVEMNNSSMLMTYDELQKNVVLLKVDMFQALNIKVDFVDADGD
jgi:hypothetical protein